MKTLHPRAEAGFTLVEAMVGVSLFAVLAALTIPKIEDTFSHAAVKAAKSEILSKFQMARMVATQGSRTAIVRRSGNRVWVEARPRVTAVTGSVADTIGPMVSTRRAFGVYISYSTTIDSVVYDPRGLATSGGTILLYRDAITDSVVVNPLGMASR